MELLRNLNLIAVYNKPNLLSHKNATNSSHISITLLVDAQKKVCSVDVWENEQSDLYFAPDDDDVDGDDSRCAWL